MGSALEDRCSCWEWQVSMRFWGLNELAELLCLLGGQPYLPKGMMEG